MIGCTIGNFHIVSEIGCGGMGVVYLAEHLKLPKRFAVKRLSSNLAEDSNLRARFYQEATNQALLDHPNIVRVVDFIEDNGQYFLVMDYIQGRDLKTILKSSGSLGLEMILKIMKGVLSGLSAAHSKNIVHRDIKPSNILIDSENQPYITDFGIAVIADSDATRLTQIGCAVGTANYMSPEQICAPHEIDHRSDIYAVGIMLYEMLTGCLPYQGDSNYNIQTQQIQAPFPDPRDKNSAVSAELAQIVLKATNKIPACRFQSCQDFLVALETCSTIEAQKVRTKPVMLCTALSSVILAGVVIGAIWLRGSEKFITFTPQLLNHPHTDLTAFGLIESASLHLMDLCRYRESLEEKKKALIIATNAENAVGSATIDMLRASIETEEKRVEEVTKEYERAIGTLETMEQTIVETQFRKAVHAIDSESNGIPLSFMQSVIRRYHEHNHEHNFPNAPLVADECVKSIAE